MPGRIQLAVVDLGSNSFHLVVAELRGGQLYTIEHLREQTQIANGLEGDNLSAAAQSRALACLERFSRYIRDLPHSQVSIAGTYTLRKAHNLKEFLNKAEAILGHPVRIITGEEEAEVIYKGVIHSGGLTDNLRLVLDIGGGSTEIILGKNDHPLLLNSLELGCVRLAQEFFNTASAPMWINADFQKAYISACNILAPLRNGYWQKGWQECWGTSGTLDAITHVLMAHHWVKEPSIDRRGLENLRRYLEKHDHLSLADLPGLTPERASVFASGLAILCAFFDVFEVQQVRYSSGGLREGLLYELAEHHGADREVALHFV